LEQDQEGSHTEEKQDQPNILERSCKLSGKRFCLEMWPRSVPP